MCSFSSLSLVQNLSAIFSLALAIYGSYFPHLFFSKHKHFSKLHHKTTLISQHCQLHITALFSLRLTEWTKNTFDTFQKSYTQTQQYFSSNVQCTYIKLTSMCCVSDCNCVFVYLFCSFSPSLHTTVNLSTHNCSSKTCFHKSLLPHRCFRFIHYSVQSVQFTRTALVDTRRRLDCEL